MIHNTTTKIFNTILLLPMDYLSLCLCIAGPKTQSREMVSERTSSHQKFVICNHMDLSLGPMSPTPFTDQAEDLIITHANRGKQHKHFPLDTKNDYFKTNDQHTIYLEIMFTSFSHNAFVDCWQRYAALCTPYLTGLLIRAFFIDNICYYLKISIYIKSSLNHNLQFQRCNKKLILLST